MTTVRETVERIQKAGVNNTRIVPTGSKVKIEILTSGGWATVIKDVNRNVAEDIIRQATNRVILG